MFHGYIHAPADDIYSFSINSDDGSQLLIDGSKIIDNDGLHAGITVAGQVALRQGYHEIEVRYFDYLGGRRLDYDACRGKDLHAKKGDLIFRY